MQRRIPKREEFPYFPENVKIHPNVDLRDLMPGCSKPDCIPSIDNPKWLNTSEAKNLYKQSDQVLGMILLKDNKIVESYAFPINIMNYHEIVNFSTLSEDPIAITFCPLCSTSSAYNRIINGDEIILGVSGLLYNSALIMYDRNSMSLISQVWSKGIVGKYVNVSLPQLPVIQTTLSQWIVKFPDSNVLSTDTGFKRYFKLYDKNPYVDYLKDDKIRFPLSRDISSELPAKEVVYLVRFSEKRQIIIPKSKLRNKTEEVSEGIYSYCLGNGHIFFSSEPIGDHDSPNFPWSNIIPSEISFYFAARAYYPDAELK
ncbi:MAG: hypothetical protein HeimC3_04990 [Candidatus Heimdallarchaeota archaeon LC_3]|nr:MAG: hypothetical protein HeimC3_04990 [Candidatus Heimdallarchaeota archaeon LC_3]